MLYIHILGPSPTQCRGPLALQGWKHSGCPAFADSKCSTELLDELTALDVEPVPVLPYQDDEVMVLDPKTPRFTPSAVDWQLVEDGVNVSGCT